MSTATPAPRGQEGLPEPVGQQQTTVVNVYAGQPPAGVIADSGPGMLIRIAWYVFVGWWLSGLVMLAASILLVTVVGIPVALALMNRLPAVLTLRPVSRRLIAVADSDGPVRWVMTGAEQRPMWLRTLYFLFIGWWAAIVVGFFAWLLSVTVVGLPVGLMLLNRLPATTTLRRN